MATALKTDWRPLFGPVHCKRTGNGSYARCWACGAETGRLSYFDAITWAHGHTPRCPQPELFRDLPR